MSHVALRITHTNESRRTSYHTYKRVTLHVISHIQMNHIALRITRTNESRRTSYHTYKRVTLHVISHIQHVARIHKSCHTVISHIQMRQVACHITHTDESRRTSYYTYK